MKKALFIGYIIADGFYKCITFGKSYNPRMTRTMEILYSSLAWGNIAVILYAIIK